MLPRGRNAEITDDEKTWIITSHVRSRLILAIQQKYGHVPFSQNISISLQKCSYTRLSTMSVKGSHNT